MSQPISGGSDVMAIRIAMAQEGWSSDDKLTDQGWGNKFGYSIWFWRYDWHGQSALKLVGNKACYHAHSSALDRLHEVAARAAERARRAWLEFPDVPPTQGGRGELETGVACGVRSNTSGVRPPLNERAGLRRRADGGIFEEQRPNTGRT